MKLVSSTHNIVYAMAYQLAINDSDTEQSTYVMYKRNFQRKDGNFFILEHKENIIGFMIAIDNGDGEWLFWLSLDKPYRNWMYGKLATHLSLSWIFGQRASYVLSEVDPMNKRSVKIHSEIMKLIKGDSVNLYFMANDMFLRNVSKYKIRE